MNLNTLTSMFRPLRCYIPPRISLYRSLSIILLATLYHPSNASEIHTPITVSFKIEEIYDRENLKHLGKYFPEGEALSWEVVLPRGLEKDEARGIFVYVSPTESGSMPPRYQEIINEEKLIWIGANASGNSHNSARRVLLGLLARHIASGYAPIDSSRMYLSGFSGGGRVASMMMWEYPDSFNGAIFFSGVNSWKRKNEDFLPKLQNKRLVFLTGSRDFNEKDTKTAFTKYQRKGIKNSTYLSILGHGHSLPTAKWFARSIQYLDCEQEEFDECIVR